jgi:phosphoglycolate phosphatase
MSCTPKTRTTTTRARSSAPLAADFVLIPWTGPQPFPAPSYFLQSRDPISVKTKLVLFDIDQTILHSGGAGEKALTLALRDRLGHEESLENIEIAGKTDIWITHRIFEAHGIDARPETVENFLNTYLVHLKTQLGLNHGRLLPGFPAILLALEQRPNVAMGLLTGNLRRGAELKLRHYGVLDHFSFGAFADDSQERNQLGPFARTRAEKAHGVSFRPEDIFIIGDTPHDIACALAIHAQGVGVATGRYGRPALEAAGAHFVFDDLSDIDAVIRTLGL